MTLAVNERFLSLLAETFSYDPTTGEIRWKRNVGQRGRAGKPAGHVWSNKEGKAYRLVMLEKKSLPAHCVAYFLMTGLWPTGEVDHRDSDGLNNSWGNLRHGTKSQNQANARIRKDNSTGFKGVSAKGSKFISRIQADNQRIFIGCFDTPEAAHAAYVEKSISIFGEFSRGA